MFQNNSRWVVNFIVSLPRRFCNWRVGFEIGGKSIDFIPEEDKGEEEDGKEF